MGYRLRAMPCELIEQRSPRIDVIDLSDDSPSPDVRASQSRGGMFGVAARRVPKVARRAHAVPQVINIDSDSENESSEDEPLLPHWPEELTKRWPTRMAAVAAVKLDSTINGKQLQVEKNASGSTRCVLR